jgi:hypothetical protein
MVCAPMAVNLNLIAVTAGEIFALMSPFHVPNSGDMTKNSNSVILDPLGVVTQPKNKVLLKKPGVVSGLFSLCARQGALTSWLKSNAGPARGTASRTARVSIARWNLKEGDGKALV